MKLLVEKIRFPNSKFTPWDVRGWRIHERPVIAEELALIDHLLYELEERAYIEKTPHSRFHQAKNEYFLVRKK